MVKKPHELRRLAGVERAAAAKLYESHKGDDADDFTEDELKRYDDHIGNAEKYIEQAEAIERREATLNELDRRIRTQAPANPDGTSEESDDFEVQIARRNYSLLRVCRLRHEGRSLDGWEAEVSQEIAKRAGRQPQGFYFPMGLSLDPRGAGHPEARFRADLTTTTGAGAVPTFTPPNTIIDLLRNRSAIIGAGAQLLTGLTGAVSVPRQSGASTWSWVQEGNAPASSALTIDTVPLTPKTGAARTLITRRMMVQASLDVEMLARADLAAVAAIGIDYAFIAGPTAGPQVNPLGILNTTAIPTVAIGANGGNLTLASVIALETAINSANADLNQLTYLTNAKVVGHAKQQPKIGSTYPIYIMSDDRSMNGYPTVVTNNVPSNLTKGSGTNLSALIFGCFSQYLIGMWGALDILTDPYTSGGSGGLNLYALQDVDGAARHPECFAKIVDITA